MIAEATKVRSLPSLSSAVNEDWPALRDTALTGLPGRVVEAVDPFTEADRAAVLVTFLTAFGSCVGSAPHVMVGADVHRANLFTVLVGRSSKARKGGSLTPIRALFALAAPEWGERVITGLGSGEGLVHVVRDGTSGPDGRPSDPGEPDKRACIVATEFGGLLRVTGRQGSTLSPVLRDAWDRGDLRVTTKNSPLRATGAHVSVVAHITEDELRRELTDTEAASGFGNRFLWIAARRSKLLAEPEPFDASAMAGLAREIERTLYEARTVSRVVRDDDARAIWRAVYPRLSRDRYGLAGTLTDRAEAQVVRLGLIYALAERSRVVRGEHLEAALALWEYAEASATRLFGSATGDPLADELESTLRRRGAMSRTDIRDLFGRHRSAHRIESALGVLQELGRAHRVTVPTGGRPTERWEIRDQSDERLGA